MTETEAHAASLEYMKLIARMLQDTRGEPPDLGTFLAAIGRELVALSWSDVGALLYGPHQASPDLEQYPASQASLPHEKLLVVSGEVVGFLQHYLAGRQITSVHDPYCGLGTLLHGVASLAGVQRALGFTECRLAVLLARAIESDPSFETRLGNPFDCYRSEDGLFDLVVSCLPYGLGYGDTIQLQRGRLYITCGFARAVMAAGLRLTDRGEAILLVGDSFFAHEYSDVREGLVSSGLQLDAIVSVPPGRAVVGLSIPTSLIFIRHTSPVDLFVAELPDDPQRLQALVANLRARSQGADPGLGALTDPVHFIGHRAFRADEQVRLLAKPLALVPRPVAEVASEVTIGKETDFEHRPNAIVLQTYRSEAPNSGASDTSRELTSSAQVVLDPDVALADYVSSFLNSPLGAAILEQMASRATDPQFTRNELDQIQIYLPDLSVQTEALRLDSELRSALSELQELRSRLWADPTQAQTVRAQLNQVVRSESEAERFEHWIDALPFPLATILWSYRTSTDDKQAYELLLHFFEALAEFMATILLSGFQTEPALWQRERQVLYRELEKHHLSLERPTFGVWNTILARLSSVVRRMWARGKEDERSQSQALFCTHDPAILDLLASTTLMSALQKANSLRNQWTGHGGVVEADESTRRRAELESLLVTIRAAFGTCWDHYELILPEEARFRAGVFHYYARRVMGAHISFERIQLDLEHQLHDDRLYLVSRPSRRALQLLPFVKISHSPNFAKNACYFYNRKADGGLRFVSYHFAAEAEIADEHPDTVAALQLFAEQNPGQ